MLRFRKPIRPGSVPAAKNAEAAVRRCSSKCSEKFRNIHRKITVLGSLFNKVARLKACNFVKKRLQGRRFPVNIAKFLGTENISGGCFSKG